MGLNVWAQDASVFWKKFPPHLGDYPQWKVCCLLQLSNFHHIAEILMALSCLEAAAQLYAELGQRNNEILVLLTIIQEGPAAAQ